MSGSTAINAVNLLNDYCERAGDASLWAEPLNALTNLAFLYAAFLAAKDYWRMERHFCPRTLDIMLLTVLLAAIGVGSGLWHLFATHATMLADVIPITLFINLYLVCFMRRVMRFGWGAVAGLWGVFFTITYLGQITIPAEMLNGSVMYAPAFFTLLLLGVWSKRTALPEYELMRNAILVFSVSITCRTIDHAVCATLPTGSHFLWHVLNAVTLYLLLRLLIQRAHVNGEH